MHWPLAARRACSRRARSRAPAPSRPRPPPVLDCAAAVAAGEQGPTVNQAMAALGASVVEKLLAGTCAWMAVYVDLDDGTLRCVLPDPGIVAQIAGLHPNAVAPPGSQA